MTKIKGTKVTREQFEQEKNTKTQKTHGRKSQEDFKEKNTKTQHVVMCFCVFFSLQHKVTTNLTNNLGKFDKKNTKRHKTQTG